MTTNTATPGTAATAIADYRQRMNGADTIGDLLWFSIVGARVMRETMVDWFNELGLDDRYLPHPIKPVDAFRKATGEARLTYDLPGDGETAELMIREVDYDNDHVVRHVMREVRDRRNKRLSYERVGEAIFYRQSRSAKVQGIGGAAVRFTLHSGLDEAETTKLKAFVDLIQSHYIDLCTYLHSDAVRACVRNYVTDLNAVLLRPSGGVYFVHASRRSTVDALRTMVKRVSSQCRFDTVPLPDSTEQREMVTDAFQEEIVKATNLLLRSIGEANDKYKGGKIPPTVYARIQAQYQASVERSEEFTRVLGLAQGRAGSALEMALDAVMDLAVRIDSKG